MALSLAHSKGAIGIVIIVVEDIPRLYLVDGDVPSPFTIDGKVFHERATGEDKPVFYDWLLAEGPAVAGLELHLPLSDPLLNARLPLAQLHYVKASPFPTIMLRAIQSVPAGLEAFGDIRFFSADDGTLGIVVGDSWLDETAAHDLQRMAVALGQEDIRVFPPEQ